MVIIALTAAEECSPICPLIISPICASDGVITRTFSNACEMNLYNCLNPGRRKLSTLSQTSNQFPYIFWVTPTATVVKTAYPGVAYSSGIQPGVRVPPGVREDILGGKWNQKENILFHDKHGIIRARFRVSHNRPGSKNMRFGSAICSLSLSLSLLYVILIWAASFILFHIVHIIYLLFNKLTLLFLI
jgi:hypothetical protein